MIKELDGIRAIALILVVNFHIGMYISWIPGYNAVTGTGYLGVQIFFFLSSLLLSRQFLLAYNQTQNKLNFITNFYKKRILRIYPLFLFSSLALYLIGYDRVFSISYSLSKILLFVSFIKDIRLNPVTWSLFMEMHFYLILPLLMHFLCKLTQKQHFKLLSTVVACFFGLAYAYRAYVYYQFPSEAEDILYVSFLANADCFLLGIAAALLYEKFNLKIKKPDMAFTVIQIIALIIVFACMYLRFYKLINIYVTRFTYVMHNIAWAVFTLFILLHPHGIINKFLSSKIMVKLSILSYGIYLWHYPIRYYVLKYFVISQNPTINSLNQFILIWAISVIISIVTYRIVELPFLSKKKLYHG